MGTKVVDSKPQRPSSGIGAQNQTSARKSKLPTKGGSSMRTPSAGKNRGRSGSIEPVSRVSAGTKTHFFSDVRGVPKRPNAKTQPLPIF